MTVDECAKNVTKYICDALECRTSDGNAETANRTVTAVVDNLQALVASERAAAETAERERCAGVCDGLAAGYGIDYQAEPGTSWKKRHWCGKCNACHECRDAIRRTAPGAGDKVTPGEIRRWAEAGNEVTPNDRELLQSLWQGLCGEQHPIGDCCVVRSGHWSWLKPRLDALKRAIG